MTCSSHRALPNSHLRVGCHSTRQPLFSSACPPDEFSCLARPVQRPAPVRRKICAADFPRGSPSFRQRAPLTNFPAWPGRSSPCSSKNLRCRFSTPQPLFSSAWPPDEFSCLARPVQRPAPVRRKICAADFPRRTCSCTNPRCHCPIVWTNSLFHQALDYKSSRLIASTRCRFCRLCRFRRRCRFQHCTHRV